jgi:hypothetical protein
MCSSLLHIQMASVYYSLFIRFLATDFNTGTIIVSLNYGAREISSQPDCQLSTYLVASFFHYYFVRTEQKHCSQAVA